VGYELRLPTCEDSQAKNGKNKTNEIITFLIFSPLWMQRQVASFSNYIPRGQARQEHIYFTFSEKTFVLSQKMKI
jgi:hypothetical protein